MTAKIRIKMGQMEVEYEGELSYLKEGLADLMEKISTFSPKMVAGSGHVQDEADDLLAPKSEDSPKGGDLQMTAGTIAARLNSKTGPDLIIAAAARLTLVMRVASFHRKDLLREMKSATGYYNKVYSNNLSRYLQQLVKQKKLHGVSEDTYSLTPNTRSELEGKLA